MTTPLSAVNNDSWRYDEPLVVSSSVWGRAIFLCACSFLWSSFRQASPLGSHWKLRAFSIFHQRWYLQQEEVRVPLGRGDWACRLRMRNRKHTHRPSRFLMVWRPTRWGSCTQDVNWPRGVFQNNEKKRRAGQPVVVWCGDCGLLRDKHCITRRIGCRKGRHKPQSLRYAPATMLETLAHSREVQRILWSGFLHQHVSPKPKGVNKRSL